MSWAPVTCNHWSQIVFQFQDYAHIVFFLWCHSWSTLSFSIYAALTVYALVLYIHSSHGRISVDWSTQSCESMRRRTKKKWSVILTSDDSLRRRAIDAPRNRWIRGKISERDRRAIFYCQKEFRWKRVRWEVVIFSTWLHRFIDHFPIIVVIATCSTTEVCGLTHTHLARIIHPVIMW